jgi:hypothetical protein
VERPVSRRSRGHREDAARVPAELVSAAARAVPVAEQLGEQLGADDGAAVALLAPRHVPDAEVLHLHQGGEVVSHGSFSER